MKKVHDFRGSGGFFPGLKGMHTCGVIWGHRAGRDPGVWLQCDEPNGQFREGGVLVLAHDDV